MFTECLPWIKTVLDAEDKTVNTANSYKPLLAYKIVKNTDNIQVIDKCFEDRSTEC